MKNKPIMMVVMLSVISVVSAFILAAVYDITKDRIAEEQRKEFLQGLLTVLPEFDNEPDREAFEFEGNLIYPAKKDGKVLAYALKASSNKGYSGEISILIGIDNDGKVVGIEILKHAETPGLGNKIEFPEFRNSFKGLSKNDNIAVKKDGGDIEQFSGATISPRAVCEAVKQGLSLLDKALVEVD